MITINVISMLIAAMMLIWMLMRTRCHDSIGWWAFRLLVSYTLVCFVYLAYDTLNVGHTLPTRYLFIRLGWVTLVAAMFILWKILSSDHKKTAQSDFKTRLKNIFNLGE